MLGENFYNKPQTLHDVNLNTRLGDYLELAEKDTSIEKGD